MIPYIRIRPTKVVACLSSIRSVHTKPIAHSQVLRSVFCPVSMRTMSSGMKNDIRITDTNIDVFHTEADAFLFHVQSVLEEDAIQDTDMIDDADYIDGILKVIIPKVGTWVLNKHSFTKQIWMSSPITGPSKYNYHSNTNTWIGEKSDKRLDVELSNEFTDALKVSVVLSHV